MEKTNSCKRKSARAPQHVIRQFPDVYKRTQVVCLKLQEHSQRNRTSTITHFVRWMYETRMHAHEWIIHVHSRVHTHAHTQGVSLSAVLKSTASIGTIRRGFMIISFAASVPIGVGIGTAIQGGNEKGMVMAITEGAFQSFSGGLLLYVALFQIIGDYSSRSHLIIFVRKN